VSESVKNITNQRCMSHLLRYNRNYLVNLVDV